MLGAETEISRETVQGRGFITGCWRQQIQAQVLTLLLASLMITFIRINMVIIIAVSIFRGMYYRSGNVLKALQPGKS